MEGFSDPETNRLPDKQLEKNAATQESHRWFRDYFHWQIVSELWSPGQLALGDSPRNRSIRLNGFLMEQSTRLTCRSKNQWNHTLTNVRVALFWMQYCLQKLNLWRILHTKQSTMHYMFHRKYEGKHPFYRTPVISGSMTTWTWMTTHKSCGDVCKYEVGKLLVSNGTERSLCIQDNKNCAGSLWNFNGWYCRCIHIYICGDILYVLRYITLLTRVAWSLSPAARMRNKNILDGEGFWEERPVGTIL